MSEQTNERPEIEINDDAVADNSSPPKNRPLNTFIDYVELFVVAICVVILLFSMVFRTCTVDGSSMNETLYDEETLLVSDIFYTPKRQDIIVFHNNNGSTYSNNNKPLVKRVIGVGGDTVAIDHVTHKITITSKDGETFVLDEEYVYLDPTLGDPYFSQSEYVVPEGKLFVMGDNRRDSLDSRYSEVGFVDIRSVLGKVYFRISPFAKFGKVD